MDFEDPRADHRRSGRDEAVDALFRREHAHMVAYARLLVDDVQTAEDVVQEAFAALHRHWSGLAHEGAALGYLRTAVANGACSQLRRRRTVRAFRAPGPVEVPSAESVAVRHENEQRLWDALVHLPLRQREVVLLLSVLLRCQRGADRGRAGDQPRLGQATRLARHGGARIPVGGGPVSTTNRPPDPTEVLRAALAHHVEQTMALTDTERELGRFHDTVRRRRSVARLVAAAAAVTLVVAAATWGLLGVDRSATVPGPVAVPRPSATVELGPVAEVVLPGGTVGVGMAQAGGSLWVLTAAGDLVEVDPRTNRVVRQVTPGGGVTGELVAVGDDLWVGAERDGSRGYARIPAGASAADAFIVTGAGPRQGGLAGHPLAAGRAGLWGTADDGRALVRLDPRSAKELSRSPLPFAAVSVEVGEDVVWAGAADGSTAVLDIATGTVGKGPPLKVGPIGPSALIGRSAWILDADSADIVRAETSCGCPVTTQGLPDGVSSPPDAAGEVFGTDGQVHALYRTTAGWQLVRVDDISAVPSSRTALGEFVAKPLVVFAFDDVWVLRPDGSALERLRT